jgi:type I restriction enzyme S subunit
LANDWQSHLKQLDMFAKHSGCIKSCDTDRHNNWQEVSLASACIKVTDGSHFSPTPRSHGRPIANVKDLRPGFVDILSCTKIAEEDFQELVRNGCDVQRHDVLLSKDGTIGRVVVYEQDEPLVALSSIAILRPGKALDPFFLGQALQSSQVTKQIGILAGGSALHRLVLRDINRLFIPLPSLAEQSRIAAVLDTVDEAIAKTEAVIAKLKQVRIGLLHDLLTCGLDEYGQLRNPIVHPEQFQDSPLGCIPRVWQCKTLEEAADWYSGGTPSRSQAAWWQGDVPILTPKDIKVLEFSDTIEHVTEEAAQMGSKVMPASTAFIVVRGMILAHTFPVCLSTRPLAFNQDIKAVCGRGELSTRFLAHWFAANSALFLRKATEATHGTKKLDSDELHRIRIAIPSPEEQQAIVKWIEAIDANIAVESDKHAKLGLVKSGVMSDLLTGRVRVPEEIAVAP